ncbi:hypothetical protein MOF52_22630, partial [Bacillus inaquosorum]|uniref:hypothetical protein n=1 Tax=Bacillus inaquosorum TaxID=483913 RepID=UPI002281FA71
DAEYCHLACSALDAASSFCLRKRKFYYFRGLLTPTPSGFILKAGKSSPRHHIREGLFQLNWHFSER